jgi:hypothetical protein
MQGKREIFFKTILYLDKSNISLEEGKHILKIKPPK